MHLNSIFRSNGFSGTTGPKATYSNHTAKSPKEPLFGLDNNKYRLEITGLYKTL